MSKMKMKEIEAPRIKKEYIIQRYDDIGYRPFLIEYFGYSDFLNFGYWRDGTNEQKEACENLMEELLQLFSCLNGTILDVACGKGATTRFLMKYCRPDQITGINISEKQLETALVNAPGCRFLCMDATELHFDDNLFNNIICVEAAFHFDTREKFLKEAWRVLKDQGQLVLSDILMTLEGERATASRIEQNYVDNLNDYKMVLERTGFNDVKVVDATEPCWKGHFWAVVRKLHQALLDKKISESELHALIQETYRRARYIKYYVLAAARKT